MDTTLCIYTDMTPLDDGHLKNLSPLFSFHWQGLSKEEIFAGKTNISSPFKITNDPDEADFFALPMHWTYYLWNGKAKMHEANMIAETAKRHSRQMIIWFKGDLVPVIPFDNAILFLPGTVGKRMQRNYRACPVFINDPEQLYGKLGIQFREKKERPVVGFCGYGSIGVIKLSWSILSGLYSYILERSGGSDFSECPILPATIIRSRAMSYLSRHPGIDTRFHILSKHTARQPSDTQTEKALSFYENIFGTDYTLCVRGFGNWSYRFYETLACGRIPIFVDSDCVLPLESSIDWRQYCIWVSQSDLDRIGEIVLDFHASLSKSEFIQLQEECRKLWLEQLTLDGCMNNIRNYLDEQPLH